MSPSRKFAALSVLLSSLLLSGCASQCGFLAGGSGDCGECVEGCGDDCGCGDSCSGRSMAFQQFKGCGPCQGPKFCPCTGPECCPTDCGCGCGEPCGCEPVCGCEQPCGCGEATGCGDACGCGQYQAGYKPCRALFNLLCGCNGCDGELYWSEWHNDPPRCCDPCDRCGNWVGPPGDAYRAPYAHPYAP